MSGIDNEDPFEFEPEFDEQLERQWEEEFAAQDREAVSVLRQALSDHRGAPVPIAVSAAADALRAGFAEGLHPFAWMRKAAGLQRELPGDDVELLLRTTAATISPREETGLDIEEEATLVSLEHADWLGAIVTAARGGAGADISPSELVEGIRTCPEVNIENVDFDEEATHLEAAFWIVALPWQVLGLTDRQGHLTPVGAWVLPRALARAWDGEFD